MQIVTVSLEFQVVIPSLVREQLNVHVGQKMQVIGWGNRIELIPFKSAKQLRGFLRDIDTTVEREGERV